MGRDGIRFNIWGAKSQCGAHRPIVEENGVPKRGVMEWSGQSALSSDGVDTDHYFFFKCCFKYGSKSTETVWTVRDREPSTSTSTFTQLLRSGIRWVQCCFTFTETVRNVKDGAAQDIHRLSHSSWALWFDTEFDVQCWFIATEARRTIREGRETPDVHLDFHTVPSWVLTTATPRYLNKSHRAQTSVVVYWRCLCDFAPPPPPPHPLMKH